MKLTFNKIYGITDKQAKPFSYFDPILVKDTKLFLDPFLLLEKQAKIKEFKGCYQVIVDFFQKAFELAAKIGGIKNSTIRNKLRDMLKFPEDNGFKLGYASSVYGLGGGAHLRDSLVKQIEETLHMSKSIPEHFEQIGLFVKDVGCDTISDIILNILKYKFIAYTQRICSKLNIKMVEFNIKHYKFNFSTLRWEDKKVLLPINKCTNQHIILVPKIFLKHLPTINANAFSDYIWQEYNETLRNDFSYDIKSKIKKSDIIKLATENPNWVKDFISEENKKEHQCYDFSQDKYGLVPCHDEKYQKFIKDCIINAKKLFTNLSDYREILDALVLEFKNFIEDCDGLSILWDGDKHKPETTIQTMFELYLYSLKKILNFDVSRESKASNGFLDFKFSNGSTIKLILETKHIDNSQFWSSYSVQLPIYMRSEKTTEGTLLCVAYTDDDINKYNTYLSELKKLPKDLNIKLVMIDARKKESPSKRKEL